MGKADTVETLQSQCAPWCHSFVNVVRQDQIQRHGRDLLLSGNSCQGNESLEDVRMSRWPSLTGQVYGANYPRLRRAKAKYDPNCVFARYFAIEPDFS